MFLACVAFHLWGVGVGWESKNLPGVEYRQAQTALSAYFIKEDGNFSLAYPTPVLGKPWSIPMEFPLYQWTVVGVSELTGWGITLSGRLVGIVCFYLMLPAVWLLLARWAVAPPWRWLVLAVVVTCPFHVFYARAVLIETMALMFALWYWVAVERAVTGRDRRWLALAVVAGVGAALVKITTLLVYGLPLALWGARRLWQARAGGVWRGELGWLAAAAAVPLAAGWWWVRTADAIKARNPLADFLGSGALQSFNFGTADARLSPTLWAQKWQIVEQQLTWLPLVAIALVLAGLAGRARLAQALACLGFFAAPLVVFPVLYAFHDYYFMANTVLLTCALGLGLVAVAETRLPRGVVLLAALTVTGAQVGRYLEHYHPAQRGLSAGGNGLSDALRMLTESNDYVVITGEDWNSMTPYYAQRRALMLRDDPPPKRERVEQAWANLADEKLGALVITGPVAGKQWLVDLAVERGLGPTPLLHWRDTAIYLPVANRERDLMLLEQGLWPEIRLAEGVELPESTTAGRWLEVAAMRPGLRRNFYRMTPQPVRVFTSFGIGMDESSGQYRFGAHPETRLVFALGAGRHALRSSIRFSLDAYRVDLPDGDATDGVEIRLSRLVPGEPPVTIHTQIFNPRVNSSDRGEIPLEISFSLSSEGEVELFIGPGPRGNMTRDWVALGALSIVPASGP